MLTIKVSFFVFKQENTFLSFDEIKSGTENPLVRFQPQECCKAFVWVEDLEKQK